MCELLSDRAPAAIHSPKDVDAIGAIKECSNVGLEMELPDAGVADVIVEERDTYSRDGEKAPSFSQTLVPVLKEKSVTEHLVIVEHTQSIPVEDLGKEAGVPANAKVGDSQMFGTPAEAPKTAKEPVRVRTGKNDADAEEQKASSRKYMRTKSGQSPWTVPTSRPKYNADSFEDPVCDEFWKDIWEACASRNVRVRRTLRVEAMSNR
jgi:phospholipase D1/2